MRLAAPGPLVSALAMLPAFTAGLTLDCKKIVVNKVEFDLSPLKGAHTVIKQHVTSTGAHENTTFTFDLCDNLDLDGSSKKRCSMGTRVCASKFVDGQPDPEDIWPIAGEFSTSHGRGLEPGLTRLKDSDLDADADKEGLRIELNGGIHESEPQRALIELQCDRDTTGLEGEGDKKQIKRRADDDGGEDEDEDGDDDDDGGKDLPQPEGPLQYVTYSPKIKDKKVVGTLEIIWKTKYACEDEAGKEKPDTGNSSSGWGFFTWAVVIVFLATSGYLVFGAWLNYNRYGARGWDLLPHGDTIRDVPYILKDWGRRVLGLVQGGSRGGGYSAI